VHKVLLVDDDEDVLTAIAAILTLAGYAVEEADGIVAARAQMERAIPDVVICDWDLGGETSTSFLLDLAAARPAIGRVLLSGSPFADLEALVETGAVHVALMKPSNVAEVLAAILEALARASPR
jgi:two-component system, OmpR family, phosphate regulon response regulator PhoB